MLTLGKIIKSMRALKGLRQTELAHRADITPAFLSLIENEQRDFGIKTLERIAAGLEMPIEVLIWESVELPSDVGEEERRVFDLAKGIVTRAYFAEKKRRQA